LLATSKCAIQLKRDEGSNFKVRWLTWRAIYARPYAGGAAARETVNVNPGGDWTTQTEDPAVLFRAMGAGLLKLAAEGDRAAQYSMVGRCRLTSG